MYQSSLIDPKSTGLIGIRRLVKFTFQRMGMELGMGLGMEVVVEVGSDGRVGGQSGQCDMVVGMVLLVVVVEEVELGG